MVSTPTAAANLLNQSWLEAELELKRKEREVFGYFSSLLSDTEYSFNNLFLKIKERLEKVFASFRMIEYKIKTVVPKILENEIKKVKEKMESMERVIINNNPERNLKLGYCIARNEKGIIKNIKDVKLEEVVDLKVFDGIINTQVKKIQKYERKKS
jgi:exonuclease VII large subunit